MAEYNALTIVCTVIAIGLLASPAMAGEKAPGDLVSICIDGGSQEHPDIDGNMVVWEDGRNGGSIYYLSSPGSGGQKVAGEGTGQRYPSVSGNYVVWEENRNMSPDICFFDVSSGVTTALTDDPADQWMPVVHGEHVVWYDARNGSTDICLYDIGTGSETFLSCSPVTEWKPALSERYVVWEESTGNGNIWLYDILDGERHQITGNGARQTYPAISGSRIVWEDYRNGAPDIYLFDLDNPAAGEQRITDDPTEQVSPAIDGDLIAWEDKRDGTWNVYICDLVAGKDKQMPVVPSATEQLYPAVSGDRVVWQNGRDGSSDIYAFTYFSGTTPVAAFSADPTEGGAVLIVRFIDQSAGDPESWEWDFGDGNTSTLQDLWHFYEGPGNYTVSLTVSNEFGSDTVTKSDLIHVGPPEPPDISFRGVPLSGPAPLTVMFYGDSPNYATAWLWDFGDGEGSVHRDTYHTYHHPGVYNVSLTCDNAGASATHMEHGYITVFERLEPSFSADTRNGTAPLTVRFTDTSTGEPDTWSWKFGDGGTSSEQNPEHTYVSPGNYTVSLTIGNGFQNETEVRHGHIRVHPATPAPTPTVNITPSASPTVNVTPSASPTVNATPAVTATQTSAPTQTSSGHGGGGGGGRGGGGGGGSSWSNPGWSTPPPTATPTQTPTAAPSEAGPGEQVVRITSSDGLVSLTIAGGIRAVNLSGAPVVTVTLESIDPGDVPPLPGEGEYVFAGSACIAGPEGAVISSPATLVFNFTEEQWNNVYDSVGKRLVVQCYNRSADAWEVTATAVHPGNRSIVAEVSNLSLYALFVEAPGESAAQMAMDDPDPQPGSIWDAGYINLVSGLLALIFLGAGVYLYFRKEGL
ncbi:PKD domain-containing protein [Methanoculleus sp.]|uniref:PKD domain-containing protein n=1 Tax=Methanoculleus sp. TaxID=90427 RepID=UPI0025E9AA75|nr:PKD domain-containing protein [Methanoculleus sp.]